jgi:hypothetical protein
MVEASHPSAQPLAKDKNHVYSLWGIVPGADPTTFTVLCTPTGGFSCYTKDKNEVLFFCGIGSPYPVREADPTTFTATDSPSDCTDNCFDGYDAYHRFYGGTPIGS